MSGMGLVHHTPFLSLHNINKIPRSHIIRSSLRDAQELVRLEIIKPVSSTDVQILISRDRYKLLDVRPVWEWERASVVDSLHIPLFVEDENSSYFTFLRKCIQMGFGGVWMGQRLTTRNEQFLEQVHSAFPEKDQRILVACGEGLRSLLALDELHDDGYTNLAWIVGGFSKSRDDHFSVVEGSSKLRFANIGGAAEYLVKFLLLGQSLTNTMATQKSADRKSS